MGYKTYFCIYSAILIVLFVVTLTGCATKPRFESFKAQSCIVVYCESYENSKVKKAGLVLIDIAASSQGIDLDLGRGFCEEYYRHREFTGGYVYAFKSAYDVCNE